MANYTVYGYIKDDSCNPIVGAKVYPYFKKLDSNSPDSKWSDSPYETDGDGYYSFNLGDNVLLGTEASFKNGVDKIYIAVVYGTDDALDSLTADGYSFVSHLTTNSDSNELNLNIEEKRVPILSSYSFPNATLTSHIYYMSENSNIDTSWNDNGCYDTMVSQKHFFDSVEIFDGHQMVDTIYSWDEIADTSEQNSSSSSYSFSSAGVYTLEILVSEKWGTDISVSSQVEVKYNEPVVDFSWSPTETNNWNGSKIKGTEEITFTNDTTDLDNRSGNEYSYEWVISDETISGDDNTKTFSNKGRDFSPSHQFQSMGQKNITLKCYWNDGFDDLEVSITKTVEIYPFTVVPDFTWLPIVPRNRAEDVEFDSSLVSGDIERVSSVDWVIEDSYPAPTQGLYTFSDAEQSLYGEGSPDNTAEVDNTYNIVDNNSPVVKFHSSPSKSIEITLNYNDGWEEKTVSLTKTISFFVDSISPSVAIDDINVSSRNQVVSISDGTTLNRSVMYYIDWTVNDFYDTNNPQNPNYGNSETDNTENISNSGIDDTITHKFQSENNHSIEGDFYFDNGWQMAYASAMSTILTSHTDIEANFSTSPHDTNGSFYGRIQVDYENTTIDDNSLAISLDWTWDDVDGVGQNSVVETRSNEDVDTIQQYTFQTPSREPYCADGFNPNITRNKTVTLNVRYDNGWTDLNYSDKVRNFEAAPNEISATVVYSCNFLNHTH